MEIVLMLLVLHGVDGREIDVNVDEITSLQCKVQGAESKLFHEGANAVVYLTDGKFVSVVETCSQIREMTKEKQK